MLTRNVRCGSVSVSSGLTLLLIRTVPLKQKKREQENDVLQKRNKKMTNTNFIYE